jgi:hypothetical protein
VARMPDRVAFGGWRQSGESAFHPSVTCGVDAANGSFGSNRAAAAVGERV